MKKSEFKDSPRKPSLDPSKPHISLFIMFASTVIKSSSSILARGMASAAKPFNRLVLVRHGESQWNKENRFTGWYDVPLSDKGRILLVPFPYV